MKPSIFRYMAYIASCLIMGELAGKSRNERYLANHATKTLFRYSDSAVLVKLHKCPQTFFLNTRGFLY